MRQLGWLSLGCLGSVCAMGRDPRKSQWRSDLLSRSIRSPASNHVWSKSRWRLLGYS